MAFGATRIARQMLGRAIAYSEYGNPKQVLRCIQYPVQHCSPEELTVRFLASPINPSDINQIEGVYPSRPSMTTDLTPNTPSAVAGNEGVVEVIDVGSSLRDRWEPGQWAVMSTTNLGTWRTHLTTKPENLIRVDQYAFHNVQEAASLTVNPCTAFMLLHSAVKLQPGDWFMQTGANSVVGMNILQLARHFGYNSINIIRARPDAESLKERLRQLGATYVITDEELMQRSEMKKLVPKWTENNPPKLGIDCVSGRTATEMSKYLANSATISTYGGMSRQPLGIPVSLLIFKDLRFHGFWLTKWKDEQPSKFRDLVIQMQEYYRRDVLHSPDVDLVDVDANAEPADFLKPFTDSIGAHGKKVMLFHYDN
ncbi:enoyl-[acyl-carrier protein] reductase [Schizosaccharomyces japonicus yFS275]|uniref:enoyl-[acyl-carrier-protein] reductase n=1 Tax=Schizosaccharomyces japonicus (strain yFS275 / FY16936) TaxID=402676 RepID=B6JZG8_SCHJY|nr:enoyl-[acyl-carrier protein] reductase [Schizosaccharomyces japonicus yFS275]EEB06936.1 enoyl-[acyl-carrier protein] reductase [Schizosaccharomyces japonicus yFS275]